jgi:hypothetical protein
LASPSAPFLLPKASPLPTPVEGANPRSIATVLFVAGFPNGDKINHLNKEVAMANMSYSGLLKNKEVMKEIERYKWIESEKAGHDIGFEKASTDWLNRYGGSWIRKTYR